MALWAETYFCAFANGLQRATRGTSSISVETRKDPFKKSIQNPINVTFTMCAPKAEEAQPEQKCPAILVNGTSPRLTSINSLTGSAKCHLDVCVPSFHQGCRSQYAPLSEIGKGN